MNGDTPLMLACMSKKYQNFKILLAYGGGGIHHFNKTNDTALSYTAYSDDVKILESLLHHGTKDELLLQITRVRRIARYKKKTKN